LPGGFVSSPRDKPSRNYRDGEVVSGDLGVAEEEAWGVRRVFSVSRDAGPDAGENRRLRPPKGRFQVSVGREGLISGRSVRIFFSGVAELTLFQWVTMGW